MKCQIVILTVLIFAACASIPKPSLHEGENLLTPAIGLDSDEWEVLSTNDGPIRSLMWRRKSSSYYDAYVVTVINRERMAPAEFRRIQDDPGGESCDQFETVNLARSEDDGLPSDFWRTECYKNGELIAQIAQLVIVGKDSLYHVQKIWRAVISREELDMWVGRLASIYVCDSRVDARMCPVGFRPIGPAV